MRRQSETHGGKDRRIGKLLPSRHCFGGFGGQCGQLPPFTSDARLASSFVMASPLSRPRSKDSGFNLLRITQRYSSYVFTGFFGVHILNNVVVPLTTWAQKSALGAVSTIDSAFEGTRKVYRPTRAVEFGLIFIPLAVHVGSGLLLRANRLKTLYPQGILPWHREKTRANAASGLSYPHLRAMPTFGLSDIAASGYITAACVVFHIFMVRYLPWKFSMDASITLVTRALQKHPRVYYAFHYTLLSAGLFHIISGWGRWLKLTASPRSVLIKNAVVTVVNLSWVASLIRVGYLEVPDILISRYDKIISLLA